jgi:molybdenum cofactor cytidylyltransferase
MQRPTATDKIEGVILAAGLSTRMGAPKLTIEIEGISIIRRVVSAALESELHRVILVHSPSDSGVKEALGSVETNPRLSQVVNPYPQAGLSSSLRTGMEALDREAAGVMILLGDQPGITGNIINELLATFRREQTMIVVPIVLGRRTTPVIFPATLFSELMEETGDIGGRNVLKRHADQVVEFEMGESYDDTDLDTPEDLDKIRSKIRETR